MRGRKGARQLAVTNAGTIPDRGLYGVHLPGRPPGGRARRGDGLRGARGPDVPARRDDLADRGDHPRPGDRHAGPGRPGSGAVLAGRRDRPPGRARPGDRSVRPRGRDADAEDAGEGLRPRPPRRREPASPTCASSRPRPASSPPTSRSSSSASATRSATGACACSRRSAGGSTPPGAWRSRRRSAASSTWRPTRSGPTTASSSTCPTPTRCPRPTWSCWRPTRSRIWSSPSSAARRCSVRASARTRRARCSCRARYPGKRTPLWQQRLKSQSPAGGGQGLPALPGHPRDLPRVPARRARPAGARIAPGRSGVAADLAGRGRDPVGLTVRLLAALRLRRHLHVRGRHAQRGAQGRGSRARPRPPPRAARPGGAARPDRPRGAGGRRATAPAPERGGPGKGPRRPAAGAPPARRPDAR